MDAPSLARVVANTSAVALPTVAPATIPAWGPSAVELFGANIPIASMVCSMIGLAMARGISSAREGKEPGGWYLTGTLAIVLFGLVVEYQPRVGTAIAWGVGIGASGILLVDLLKDKVLTLFGKKQG